MTCNNCIHYSACLWNGEYTPTPCRHFKDNADVVEVVRCKDCRWYLTANWDGTILYGCDCTEGLKDVEPNGFCSYGERK